MLGLVYSGIACDRWDIWLRVAFKAGRNALKRLFIVRGGVEVDAISLFTGCGGSDKGLVDAGCHIVMANDISKYAHEVYRENLPETDFRTERIEEIEKFPQADLLIGCYPCQGYSQGGARDTSRNINRLYREFDRALRIIRPRAFVVENVPGMARSDNLQFLRAQLVRFRSAGYRVSDAKCVNSIDYGLAQERKRIFLVGIKSELGISYEFPEATHGPGLKPYLTQRDIMEDLTVEWPSGEYYDQPFHWYYLSRNRYRGWNQPSKTILANARHMPLHPMSPPLTKVGKDEWTFDGDVNTARRLSYREAAALQDLKDWIFPDTVRLMKKYEVIGNAVPPKLFQQIVEAIPDEVFS